MKHIRKNKQLSRKMSKRMNKHFIEGKTQMVDKHIKIINK